MVPIPLTAVASPILPSTLVVHTQHGETHISDCSTAFPLIQEFFKGDPHPALMMWIHGGTPPVSNPWMDPSMVFVKQALLVDPIDAILDASGQPTVDEAAPAMDKFNAAYVDAFATQVLDYVAVQTGCRAFPKFYGTCQGISNCFVWDAAEDFDSLCSHPEFHAGVGKRFEFMVAPEHASDGGGTSVSLGSSAASEASDITQDDTPYNPFDMYSCTGRSDDCSISGFVELDRDGMQHELGGDSDSDETKLKLKNVPVQLIAMERLSGTLHDLAASCTADTYDAQEWASWLFQVCYALAVAQQAVGFTHNDLHTNNVMWVPTDEAFMDYAVLGHGHFRVPTFGRILKIIDFGRACLHVDVQGMRRQRVIMSRQFEEGGEAEGQYNYGPMRNRERPEVAPNASFDLCRLATSLLILHPQAHSGRDGAHTDPVWKLMQDWTMDDRGESVLFKGRKMHERYHDFDLYKAIARRCHNAVPKDQFKHPVFQQFRST